MSDLHSAMIDACRSIGVTAPDTLPNPGKWHELDIEGDPHGKGDARIKLFPDGEGGILYNWKTDEQQTFFANGVDRMSQEQRVARQQEIAVARIRADEDMKLERQQAAEKSAAIWKEAKSVSEHPYLTRKGIKPNGVKLHNDALVIPLRADGEIQSLQFIAPDGSKKFLTGGRVAGCYFSIGKLKDATALVICEGFATGASIHEATGHPVAVAFNAGNLLPVSKAMREKFPDLKIVLCADDDWKTPGNPGLTKATEAALSVGGLLAVPQFPGERPEKATDVNDLAQLHGLEAVKQAIANATAPVMGERHAGGESAPAGEYARSVSLIRGTDIQPESVSWVWNGWLAAGKMQVLGGAPGTGKTTIAMSLAATVTVGGRWPDGSKSPIGNVVIWSGEDDPADTLIPRLVLSGADLSRIYFIGDVRDGNEQRSFDPAKDMEPLQRKLSEIGDVRLLVVDPIVSAIAGDSHKNAEVRRGLQPLVDLAGLMRCALVGITHFSKGTGGRDPVERLTGSLAFGALARVVLVAAKHQEEGEDGRTVRLFCRAKSNIGPDDGGFEYDLQQSELKTHPGIFASSVLWGAAVEGAARELLATADATGDDGEGGTLADAKAFLLDLLADGPVGTKAIRADADGAGYSWATIRRALKAVGAESHKSGMKGGWQWSISRSCSRNTEDAQQNSVSAFKKFEHLHQSCDVIEVEI
jgi:putative DNA primase/helicase